MCKILKYYKGIYQSTTTRELTMSTDDLYMIQDIRDSEEDHRVYDEELLATVYSHRLYLS